MKNCALSKRSGWLGVVVVSASVCGAPWFAGVTPAAAAPRQTLHGHVPAVIRESNLQPLGQLPGTNRLHLGIELPLRNQAELAELLKQIYDPASTNFHRYLAPAQFAAKFGPTEADYQTVVTFANRHGLEITATSPNRMVLDVKAASAQIEAALHVALRTYQHPTENRTFYAPETEPSLDLTVPVLHISGLDNAELPRPRYKATPLAEAQGTKPLSGAGPSGLYMGGDFRAAYVPNSPLIGSGQTVGLLQFDGYTAGDIAYYISRAGLPSVTLSNVLLDGFNGRPTGSGGEVEVSLDIEMAISLAPGLSQVIVYEAGPSGNWHDILNRMATDNLAKQLSCSWYSPGGKADPVADQIFEQMAAQGQSFFNASGDNDAYTGLIGFPGDNPYITQVGGTTLTTSGPGGRWVSEKVWNWGSGVGSGGGISTSYTIPSWQTNIDMTACQGSTSRRNTPDVAMTADNVYIRADGQDWGAGGTSCAAPLWAGFAALMNQAALDNGAPVVGFINPAVYALGQTAALTNNFHDITVGNNEKSSSPTKFLAVPGYDLCTGWGTPAGSNLIYTIGVPEPLQIKPLASALFTGPVGGPIAPALQLYTLTNKTGGPLNWSVSRNAAWLTVSSTNGTLSAGGPDTTLTARPNLLASNLGPGSYSAALVFSNLADGVAQTRQATLAIVTPPVITSQPANQTVFQGMAASFSVGTSSNALEYYQWQFDNGVYVTNLVDAGNRSGCQTATLTVSNVFPADVGAYSVIITNAAGAVTSTAAFLSIVPWRPVITVQPANQNVLPGAVATFSVAAVGTQPFGYRWRVNGTNLTDGGNIAGSSTSALTVSNAAAASVGSYSVILSNSLGSATSAGAELTLIPVTVPGVSLDTLYSFTGKPYGSSPYAGLVQAEDGTFYGTTLLGGSSGYGTVFGMATNGTMSLLHAFTGRDDGAEPYAPVIIGTDGYLYGTTSTGSSNYYGIVFRMTTNGVISPLKTFSYATDGGFSVAGLLQGRDGNLYGTTLFGGISDYGTIFRTAPSGAFTVLRAFNGENGLESSSTLIQAIDGNFYGTAEAGGTNDSWGTVFRMTPSGEVAAIVSFNYTDGGTPVAGLVQDTDGSFYGTTYYGGTNGAGSVFKMSADGTLTSLYSFTGGTDGSNPFAGLLLCSDGNLYGNTESGGDYGSGTLFRLSPGGGLVTLAQFDGYQGANPEGTLMEGADGNLYGTTATGGQGNGGAIYRLSINSPLQITHQPQTQLAFLGETVTFNVATLGSLPVSYQWRKNGKAVTDGGDLLGSASRTLTVTNVALEDAANYSVVVSNKWGSITSAVARLEVIVSPPYIVSGPEDQAVLVGDTATFSVEAEGDGPLYFQWQKNGTNLTDGPSIAGSGSSVLTISAATAADAGTYSVIVSNFLDWVESDGALLAVVPVTIAGSAYNNVHAFTGGSTGYNPYAGVIQGKDGFLYGTTLYGGLANYGTTYKLSLDGTYTLLHSFAGVNDGAFLFAGLVQGPGDYLYGAAYEGGRYGPGSLFKMTTTGTVTRLYSFIGPDDGSLPVGNLIQGADGNLYGTSYHGGADDLGTAFTVATNGTLTPLVPFNQANGAYPLAPLLQASNGVLYGATYQGGGLDYGTLFALTTNGALSTLVSFNYTNGAYPIGGLVQAPDGCIYGTTSEGGADGGWGTVFRMGADGTLTTLYSFGYTDGAYPAAGLVQATDGNFYGTTSEGGLGGQGTMFRMTAKGVLTTLIWFNGINGANPQSPVIQARDGTFFGTAEYGGMNYNGAASTGNGLVFQFTLPMFLGNPFTQAVAAVSVPYAASLATNAVCPASDTLVFAKDSGPAWLNIASNGALSGLPAVSDIGINTFTVSMQDVNGWSCDATMSITVVPAPWITAAIVRQGGSLWLTWSGRSAPYAVQMTTNLSHPIWVTIAGSLSTNSLLLTPREGSAFYRIQAQ